MWEKNRNRKNRWFFGGLAASGAICFTHPIDLLKVHLQTSNTLEKIHTDSKKGSGLLRNTAQIIRTQGGRAMFNGLSASILWQLTNSTTRFGIYEVAKNNLSGDEGSPPFERLLVIAGVSGLCGGFVGNPPDIVKVRMQNDVKLPLKHRRNYKHVFHGLNVIMNVTKFINIFI